MIVCVVEHEDGQPSADSLGTLTLAARLGAQLGVEVEAVAFGERGRDAAGTLARHGAARLRLLLGPAFDTYHPPAWGHALGELVAAAAPEAVLVSGTDRGHELLAYAGAHLDLPAAANCTSVDPSAGDGPWLLVRNRWGGSLSEEAELDGPVRLLSVALHSQEPAEVAAPPDLHIHESAPAVDDPDLALRMERVADAGTGGIALADAKVVVGGGRGVGGPDAFGPLEELARRLGGAVGVSRVVTSLGWRPHAQQVGQTGTRIAPDLYIACGISGAIQHLVGAKGAKHLLAINTDADAPIMAKADWAVIGDLHEVLGAINQELERAGLGAPPAERG